MQKADKGNRITKLIQRSEKNIFLDATIFLVTDLTSYAKMISLWIFFVFVATFCTGFTRKEKQQVKVIDDDIYSRIIEFKANNEIIKMSKNYSNIDKRTRAGKYVHEHHAYDKINIGHMNVGSFPQQIWCHLLVEKICGRIATCKCNKTTYFLSQNETQSKRKRTKFLIVSVVFFTKFQQ